MRIDLTNLRIKAIKEKTDKYDEEMMKLVEKINKHVKTLGEE